MIYDNVERYSDRYSKLNRYEEGCIKSAQYMENLVRAYTLTNSLRFHYEGSEDSAYYEKARSIIGPLINEMIHLMTDREQRLGIFLDNEKKKRKK